MDFKEKRKIHWMSFYNIIACVGIVCLILPYFELASFYVANRYSTIISITVAPFLTIIGFLAQKILMRFQKKKRNDLNLEYSDDVDSKSTSKITLILSMAISGAFSAFVGMNVGSKMMEYLGPLYSNDFGVIVFTISCVAVGIIGCVLAQFKFYQILSIKTMIEYIAAFTFLLGIQMFWGNGVSILFVVCFSLFLLCLALCMNQENIVKVEYMHKTCYATNKMRWTGMKGVIVIWIFAVVLAIVLLSLWSIIRALFLLILRRPWQFILYGPIEGIFLVNIILLIIGSISLLASLILAPIVLRNPHMRGIKYQVNQTWIKIKSVIISWIKRIFKIEYKKGQYQTDEINPLFYSDSITYSPPKKHKAIYTKYKDFYRALKTISDINKQYLFAYKVLIESFHRMDIGLDMGQTPFEMALIIKEKTSLKSIEKITSKYTIIAYAEKSDTISDDDITEICDILRDRL